VYVEKGICRRNVQKAKGREFQERTQNQEQPGEGHIDDQNTFVVESGIAISEVRILTYLRTWRRG